MSDENINENLENTENEQVAEQPINNAKPYGEVIEDARQDLYKAYAKSRKISNIIMFAVVAAICGIMFLIISNNNVLKIQSNSTNSLINNNNVNLSIQSFTFSKHKKVLRWLN